MSAEIIGVLAILASVIVLLLLMVIMPVFWPLTP
jgi:hypothetical protein